MTNFLKKPWAAFLNQNWILVAFEVIETIFAGVIWKITGNIWYGVTVLVVFLLLTFLLYGMVMWLTEYKGSENK